MDTITIPNAHDITPGHRPLARGMRVGLLGGSFDPAHSGHVHISRVALKRFRLDRVIWLVSPGNPLKATGPAPILERIEFAQSLISDPRIVISDFEQRMGTTYTAESLAKLTSYFPEVSFVWLMGADNLEQLDQWKDWRGIMRRMPIGVLARPGFRQAALHSKAARVFAHARIPGAAASTLARRSAPAWCFVNMPMMPLSSSQIRARGDWGG